jgi:hypothetical protein
MLNKLTYYIDFLKSSGQKKRPHANAHGRQSLKVKFSIESGLHRGKKLSIRFCFAEAFEDDLHLLDR